MTFAALLLVSATVAVPGFNTLTNVGPARTASSDRARPHNPLSDRASVAQDRSSAQAAQWQDVIRRLRHPDAKIRLAAVEQLGNAGYTAAAESVAPLIVDPDDRVQYAAIDAELTFFLIEPI